MRDPLLLAALAFVLTVFGFLLFFLFLTPRLADFTKANFLIRFAWPWDLWRRTAHGKSAFYTAARDFQRGLCAGHNSRTTLEQNLPEVGTPARLGMCVQRGKLNAIKTRG